MSRRWIRWWPAGLLVLLAGAAATTGTHGYDVASDGLPASVSQPYLWQRGMDGSPGEPMMLTYSTDHSVGWEGTVVYVDRDGDYRIRWLDVGEDAGVLSPNGRYELRSAGGAYLDDLVSGRELAVNDGPVLWLADPTAAIELRGAGERGGRGVVDIDRIDLTTMTDNTVGHLDMAFGDVAISRDGTRLAVVSGEQLQPQLLTVYDLTTGRPVAAYPLTARHKLAGGSAWSPDGRELLLAEAEMCAWVCADTPWHFDRLDVATGRITAETRRGRAGWPELLGWRGGQPVIASDPSFTANGTCAIIAAGPVADTVLMRSPQAARGCPTVARDLIETAAFGDRAVTPAVWQVRWWLPPVAVLFLAVFAVVVGLVVGVPVGLVVGRVRRRRVYRALLADAAKRSEPAGVG